jgi:hypothetical protein
MFLKIITLGFLFYILYKFVFGFLVPVFRTTQKIKKGFRDMQQNAQDNMNRQQAANPDAGTQPNAEKKQPVGDYIEFEEIK